MGMLKNGNAVLNEDVPLFQICIAPAGDGYYAVIISLNHCVGDGYTYYKIYGMLGDKSDIVALDRSKWIDDGEPLQRKCLGDAKAAYVTSISTVLVTLLGGL